jgi:replicative DNA helicase
MTTSDDVLAPIAMPTGFPPLDALLQGGLRPGLSVLAGATGSGKSALATQIALSAAGFADDNQLNPVLFVSYEMSRHELIIRMIQQLAELADGYQPPLGFSLRDRAAAKRALVALRNLPLVINSELDSDVGSLKALLAGEGALKPSLIIIDPLSLMTSGATVKIDAKTDMAAVVTELRTLARRLEIPILLVSQLSRNASGRPPEPGDLPTANIEQDAGVVLLIDRPSYRIPNFEERTRVEAAGTPVTVSLVKSRFGPCDAIELMWYSKRLTFEAAS